MGLFRPYQRNDAAETSDDLAHSEEPRAARESQVRPYHRKEAELARRERVRPTLTKKEHKAREREIKRQNDDRAYQQTEMRPERVLLRNFIDARWTFGEFVWPILLVSFAVFIAGAFWPQLSVWATYGM